MNTLLSNGKKSSNSLENNYMLRFTQYLPWETKKKGVRTNIVRTPFVISDLRL